MSLDGVIEDPGGAEEFEHGGWSFQFDRGPEGDEFKLNQRSARWFAHAQLLSKFRLSISGSRSVVMNNPSA